MQQMTPLSQKQREQLAGYWESGLVWARRVTLGAPTLKPGARVLLTGQTNIPNGVYRVGYFPKALSSRPARWLNTEVRK